MNILITLIATLIFYIIAMLIHLYSKKDINDLLIKAVTSGSLTVVNECLRQGAYVNSADKTKTSALMIASQKGYLSIAELLILNGANVNSKNIDGITALIFASQLHHTEIVQLLLSNGAKIKKGMNNQWFTEPGSMMDSNQSGGLLKSF